MDKEEGIMKKENLFLIVSGILLIIELIVFTFSHIFNQNDLPYIVFILTSFIFLLLIPTFSKWKSNESNKNFSLIMIGATQIALLLTYIPEAGPNVFTCTQDTNPKMMHCKPDDFDNTPIILLNFMKNLVYLIVPAWFIYEITKEEKDNAADKPDNNIENELNTAIEIWLQGKENAEKLAEENFEKESRWESISHTKKAVSVKSVTKKTHIRTIKISGK